MRQGDVCLALRADGLPLPLPGSTARRRCADRGAPWDRAGRHFLPVPDAQVRANATGLCDVANHLLGIRGCRQFRDADSQHVHALVAASEDRIEEYTYNFYLDVTFQGRARGRLVERSLECTCGDADDAVISQSIEWRGPGEWAAPDGRVILNEARRHAIRHINKAR